MFVTMTKAPRTTKARRRDQDRAGTIHLSQWFSLKRALLDQVFDRKAVATVGNGVKRYARAMDKISSARRQHGKTVAIDDGTLRSSTRDTACGVFRNKGAITAHSGSVRSNRAIFKFKPF
jgi:hypothetical protein